MEMVPMDDFNSTTKTPYELNQAKIIEKGEEIFKKTESQSQSIFNKDWWYGRLMDWSMKNEHFKTQMFRFVDVLPYLNSGSEVTRHLKEYFAEKEGQLPSIFNVGVGVGSLAPALMAGAVRKNITQMAKMFITGETPKDALPVLKKARKNNLCFTVDLLGEATLSEKEALDYQSRYTELISWICKDAESWPQNDLLDKDAKGDIPKVNISVKITSLYSQISNKAWDESVETLKERLRPIFYLAKERFVFVNIDMEQYEHKEMTLQVFKDLLMEPDFREYPHFGIVIQAYLRDSFKDLEMLTQFARDRGVPITVRLVKGAYWDYETIHASQKNWPIPVYTNKKESDYNYENCTKLLLENYPHIRVALGSHNVRSIAAGMVMAESLGLPKGALEIQMLYGMADPIKKAIVQMGYRVREYATVGELIPGMAYLVRRLLENTSNESFLRSKFAENTESKLLLEDPGKDLKVTPIYHPQKESEFYNEPLLDFAHEENRTMMKNALKQVEQQLGKTFPVIIGDKEIKTNNFIKRYNPSHTEQLVGSIHAAGIAEAEQAVQTAKETFKTWKKVNLETRVELLQKVAAIIHQKRLNLMALEVYESGKTWVEADGDITEAIDFCLYYAKEMKKLGPAQKTANVLGEVNLYHYQPRGVSLVIAPWNFPLAILTGMVSASIVTGNTCIMKPAEQSSLIAYELMKILKEAGCPSGVVNYLPGYGEEVGEYLTGHKGVDIITFTGSKSVGLKIVEKSGTLLPGQEHIKKCIIEMGGKNAIIIDSDADLDEAVAGVVYSAFGFQGQKCSACSRAIVLEENYDRFLDRLIEATRSIIISYAEDPKAYLGPVVDAEAYDRILQAIEDGKREATLAFQGQVPEGGYFVPPTIFTDVKADSNIAQNEIFGPVLSVIKCKNLDEALNIANATQYALTGGAYSRSPSNIEKIKNEFDVGNLYINRGITGAMVGRHPFGGHKLSGLGSKTGGADYLRQYMNPRVTTENTMRRGFAPSE